MRCSKSVLAALWLVIGAVSCAQAPLDGAARPALPSYGHYDRLLFDDGIEGTLAWSRQEGTSGEAQAPVDRELRERVRLGDSVVRAKVLTVTSRQVELDHRWVLVVRPIEHLTGNASPGAELALELGDGPWTSRVDPMRDGLVGSEVVAFLRAYSGANGGHQVHFHILRADRSRLLAIRNEALLKQVQ